MRVASFAKSGFAVSTYALIAGLAVAALLLAHAAHAAPAIACPFTSAPPTIDGSVGTNEWTGAGSVTLAHGTVYFENDYNNLYLLYDMTGDTTLDTTLGALDSYIVQFDVNGNGVGDPGQERRYGVCNSGLANVQLYLGTSGCNWTTCQTTAAVVARGFGTSPASGTNHVIFEVAIPFSEIQAQAGSLLRVALGYYSPNPPIDELVPTNMCDFSSYLPIGLGAGAGVPALGRAELALLALLVAVASAWALRRFSAS